MRYTFHWLILYTEKARLSTKTPKRYAYIPPSTGSNNNYSRIIKKNKW